LLVATDVTMTLELVELALTWPELDYTDAAVIPPTDWLEFADRHRWPHPDMAYRLFSAARDVALRSVPTEPSTATFHMSARPGPLLA
jgi:hypothetical protein